MVNPEYRTPLNPLTLPLYKHAFQKHRIKEMLVGRTKFHGLYERDHYKCITDPSETFNPFKSKYRRLNSDLGLFLHLLEGDNDIENSHREKLTGNPVMQRLAFE